MNRILALSLGIAVLVNSVPYLPVVLQGALSSPFQQMTDAKSQAKSETEQSRMGGRLRQYQQALAIYKRLIADSIPSESLVLPSPNDLSTITPYLRGSWRLKAKRDETPAPESPEEAEDVTVDTVVEEEIVIGVEDLKENQRARLNRFVRVGQCPESLQEYIPGFYKLCLSLVRKGATERRSRRPGILQSLINGSFGHTSASQTYQLEKLQRLQEEQ